MDETAQLLKLTNFYARNEKQINLANFLMKKTLPRSFKSCISFCQHFEKFPLICIFYWKKSFKKCRLIKFIILGFLNLNHDSCDQKNSKIYIRKQKKNIVLKRIQAIFLGVGDSQV